MSGMAVGVGFVLTTLGLMAVFVWLMVTYNIDKMDFCIGAAACIAVLFIGGLVAVKVSL